VKKMILEGLKRITPAYLENRYYLWRQKFEGYKLGFRLFLRHRFSTAYYVFQRIVSVFYLMQLRIKSVDAYYKLRGEKMTERLFRHVTFRMAMERKWKSFPALPALSIHPTDILFVSSSAHPELIKMCIALKRVRPGLRCTLVTRRHAHTQELCNKWFDEVIVTGPGNDLKMISGIKNVQAKVVILRFRDIVFNALARMYCTSPLVYYSSGFFPSSRYEDFLTDPELTFEEVFESDKYLLENVEGILHFLSDDVITWFKNRGVRISCPSSVLYTASLEELKPEKILPKLSEQDGEWHIVHATGVELANTPPKLGGGAFLPIDKCRVIVNQGIHLHVYGTYFDRNLLGYAPYVELEKQNKYFHIEDNLEFNGLQTELTKYDLAWKHWDISAMPFWREYLDYVTPNFFAYLQSGVPLLMSNQMPFRERDIALKHQVGILIGDDEIGHVKNILEQNKEQIKKMSLTAIEVSKGALSYSVENLMKVVGPYL
jgi:hypothetical protein